MARSRCRLIKPYDSDPVGLFRRGPNFCMGSRWPGFRFEASPRIDSPFINAAASARFRRRPEVASLTAGPQRSGSGAKCE